MWRVQKSFRSPCATMTDATPRVGLGSWSESETRKVDSPLKPSRGNQDSTEKTQTPHQTQSDADTTSKLPFPQHSSKGHSKLTIEGLIAQLALPLNGDSRTQLSRDQSGDSQSAISPKEVRAASCPCALDGEPVSLLTQQLQALKKQSPKLRTSPSPSKKRPIQKENKKPKVNVSPLQIDSPPSSDHYLTPKEQSRVLRKSESQTDPRENRKKKYFLPRSRALPTPPRTRTCTTRRCQCPQAPQAPQAVDSLETGGKATSPCLKGKKLTSARLLEFRRFSISPEELQPSKKNISSSDDELFAQKEEKEAKPRKHVFQSKRLHRRKLVFEEDEDSIPEMLDSSRSSLTPLSKIGVKKTEQSAFFESSSGTPPMQTGGLGRRKSASPSSRASPLSPQHKPSMDSPSPIPAVVPPTTKKLDSGLRRTTTTRQLLSTENPGWEDSDQICTSEEESEEGDSSDQEVGSNSRRKKKLSFDTGTKEDGDNFCQFLVEL